MQIHISGVRSSGENWLTAHQLPANDLPRLSDQELALAGSLGQTAEEYATTRYAEELTHPELEQKAETVGHFVANWLARTHSGAAVAGVALDTFAGQFRVDVRHGNLAHVVRVAEHLIDDLLEKGSRDAEMALDRLLAANLWFAQEAKAS